MSVKKTDGGRENYSTQLKIFRADKTLATIENANLSGLGFVGELVHLEQLQSSEMALRSEPIEFSLALKMSHQGTPAIARALNGWFMAVEQGAASLVLKNGSRESDLKMNMRVRMKMPAGQKVDVEILGVFPKSWGIGDTNGSDEPTLKYVFVGDQMGVL